MNPKHRDYVAFIRVVSGVFRRDMQVIHTRTGKKLRLSNSQRLFARERETVDEAFPGDIVAIVGNNHFLIGDTLSEEAGIVFSEMPRFAPETFAYLHNDTPAHFKRFRDGLTQLLKEGVVQSFDQPDALGKVPLLGAVGPLQFDVLQYRLESEYGAKSRMETAPWSQIRWVREKQTDWAYSFGSSVGAGRLRPMGGPASERMDCQVLHRRQHVTRSKLCAFLVRSSSQFFPVLEG
jgi:peptide chain release factor 3